MGTPAPTPQPGDTFDIYQTAAGYVAVQPELQRRILLELQGGERSFNEVVAATGRSKATVSAAMRELIGKGFAKETVPPGDRRRRIYAAAARRIGSSDIPLPDLRMAVQKYVRTTSGPGYGLRAVLQSLTADVPAAAAALVWTQCAAFGRLAAAGQAADGREPWLRLGEHLEAEGVGRMLAVDLREGRLELELDEALDPKRLAAAVAGFAHGFLAPARRRVLGAAEGRRGVRIHLG